MALGPCAHENPLTARFCATCGAALRPEPSRLAFGGERRQLTVLFSDLVGSTELAAAIDPEQFREIVDDYYRICADCITEHGGHLASYLGDGVLAYFGYPVALEDAASRGVRAGLAIRDAVLEAAAQTPLGAASAPGVRVGLHTGVVVIDEVGGASRRETHALGDAMNLAARVQSAASPGEVVVTDATLDLTRGAFVVEDAGAHELKGIAEPVRLHRVVSESASTVGRATGFHATFVGRERERALLRDRFGAAAAGTGQVVLIVGEPGVGKSRLVAELRRDVVGLAGDAAVWEVGQASLYQRHTPFGVIVDLIRGQLARRGITTADAQRAAIEADVAACADGGAGADADEGARLIAELLGIADEQPRTVAASEAERRRTIAWVVRWLAALAARGPAVIVLEDVHWADPSTVEVLTALFPQLASLCLMVVLASRPAALLPLEPADAYSVVALDNLGSDDTRALIATAAGPHADDAVIDALVARSDGVPLFAEQLARAVAEHGVVDAESIPATLHDSLMARLDGLGTAKPIAQVAAVVGREFSSAVLVAASGSTVREVDAALDTLVASELMHPVGEPSARRFEFQHALVQQAAYSALLRRDRRALHRAVADVIGESSGIEVVARHRTSAEQHEEAADAWSRAATSATARSAWAEAREHFRHAIDEVRALPESPATVERELTLELQRHRAIEMSGAFAGPDTRASIDRARELSERLGAPHARISVLFGMWSAALNAGQLEGALQLATEIERAAEVTGEPEHRRLADVAFAGTLYNSGEFERAVEHAAGVIDGRDAEGAKPIERAQALMYGALAGVLLLEEQPAARWADELRMIAVAPDADLIAAVLARAGSTIVALWRRELDQVAELAALLAETADTYGIPMFNAFADLYGGWSSALLGAGDGAIARIERGLETHRGFQQGLGLNHSLSLLAEAHLVRGDPVAGLAAADEGLLAAPIDAQPMHSAELFRIRGALLAETGAGAADVRAEHDRAIALASASSCPLVVLRASTQLAAWLREQDRRIEARGVLDAALAGIGEGRRQPDIDAARALHDRLEER